MIPSAVRPLANIFSSTSLPIVPLMLPRVDRADEAGQVLPAESVATRCLCPSL